MVFPVVGEGLVEFSVLFLRDVVWVPCPEWLRLVKLLILGVLFLDLLLLLLVLALLFVLLLVIIKILNLWLFLVLLFLSKSNFNSQSPRKTNRLNKLLLK